MKLKRDIRPVTYLKENAAALLDQVNREHSPVVITQKGTARGVLLDPETFERMRDAILMLKLVAQSEESLREGRGIPHRQAMDQLRKKMKDRERKA